MRPWQRPKIQPRSTARRSRDSPKDAARWWDANGPFKPLHRITRERLTYIRDQLCQRFGRDKTEAQSLRGLSVLDIGCGGGLVSEPLARLGASVTGIDPGVENIEAAKAHAKGMGIAIDYRVATAEEIAASGATFDAVLLLEVVEHVPDVPAFIAGIAPMVKPGGIMLLSTLNRTYKAYAFMIIAAELILALGAGRYPSMAALRDAGRASRGA